MPTETTVPGPTQWDGPKGSSVRLGLSRPATMNSARMASLTRLNTPSERSTRRGPARLTRARTTITPGASASPQASGSRWRP